MSSIPFVSGFDSAAIGRDLQRRFSSVFSSDNCLAGIEESSQAVAFISAFRAALLTLLLILLTFDRVGVMAVGNCLRAVLFARTRYRLTIQCSEERFPIPSPPPWLVGSHGRNAAMTAANSPRPSAGPRSFPSSSKLRAAPTACARIRSASMSTPSTGRRSSASEKAHTEVDSSKMQWDAWKSGPASCSRAFRLHDLQAAADQL